MTQIKRVSREEMLGAVGVDVLGYSLPEDDTILLRDGLDKKTESVVKQHEMAHIAKGEEGPFWGQLLGAVAPSLISGIGSALGGGQQQSGAQQASQMAQFQPYNVTSGMGTGTFQNGQATAQLSPEYQAIRQQLLGGATGQLGAMGAYDPQQAAQGLYGQMKGISDPQAEQQRLSMENRLYRQGMLGSTGGGEQMGALLKAQKMQDLARETQAFNMAQDVQNQMLQRGMGFLGGAQGLDQSAMENLRLGGQLGGRQAAAGASAAQYPWMAAQNRSDATAGFWGQLGQGLGNVQWGSQQPMSTPYGQLSGPF